jgi:molybdopterin-guanine dinucleotide biosynthesis protein A
MGGGDKSLLDLGGTKLVDHVARRLAPQCEGLIVNANGDPSRFESLNFPVVPDSVPGHPGPLAGVLAALDWTSAHRPEIEWIVSVPGDTPFIPRDLVSRLHEAREASRMPLACAASGERTHYAVGLWPIRLRQDLHRAVVEQNTRRLGEWVRLHGHAEASWPPSPVDPFFNINTPDDLSKAQALARLEGVS